MFKFAHLALAAILAVSVSTAAFAQGNGPKKGIPNSQKYKNTGAKPSTGRSGSASLETRVLIAKQGNMLIEASTASVASGTGPGTITKAQIKVGDFTVNHNGLNAGGFFATTLPAANRGTAVQVQTNIKGIDPKRTDVVTVSTPALLRPDIAVNAVNGPPQSAPNSVVTFIATVQEKNGDVGANADCTLSVDNTVVGTASAIWVDAAGTVSCQFAHSFATPGTYTVTAAAGNVVPGDWDTANNSASTTITILEPGRAILNGSLSAEQRNSSQRSYEYRDGGYYCGYYYYYCNYRYNSTSQENYSQLWFNGSTPGASAPTERLEVSQFVSGNLQHQATLSPGWNYGGDYGDYSYQCSGFDSVYWDGTRYVYSRDWYQSCSNAWVTNPEWNSSSFSYGQRAGDVVYYGGNYYCGYWGCDSYTWLDQRSYGGTTDLGWSNGSEIRLKLNFVGTDGTSHTMDRSVTLQDYSSDVNYSYNYSWYDYYYGYYYYFAQGQGSRFYGSIYWNDQQ